MKEELVYCGVDIAKGCLDVAIGNEKRRLVNDATGHRQLINWFKQVEGPVQVICEPSGASLSASACAWADQGQPGASKPGTTICQGQWYFSQDRWDRRPGAVRIWSSDETNNAERIQFGATEVARVGESAAALNSLAGDGAKSRCSLGWELRAQIKPQAH